ncbi:MAG: hypothetical protein GXP27_15575 [Planctomycetes bacterium]|nr:hypothetical protein [Planctomycetota bacterium]
MEIAFPIPENFGSNDLVFPATSSAFVAAGSNFQEKNIREVWDLRTGKRVGAVRGELAVLRGALSPDAGYYAGFSKSKDRIVLFDVRQGKQVATITLKTRAVTDRLLFARPDRLLRIVHRRPVQVWKVPEGTLERTIEVPKYFQEASGAISPGGRYLAIIAAEKAGGTQTLRVYDLESGAVVGKRPLRSYSETGAVKCSGLEFSPDGKELAAMIDDYQRFWLVCWDVATGNEVEEWELRSEWKRDVPPGVNHSLSVLWFPNRQRWLLFGNHVFDRKAGDVVWSLPKTFNALERRVLDDERIVAAEGRARNVIVRTLRLSAEQLARAAQAIESGGLPEDAGLPPLTKADRSSARTVSLEDIPASWQVPIDSVTPAAAETLKKPISLRAGGEAVSRLLISRERRAVAALSLRGLKKDAPLRVDHYELAAGAHAGTLQVPYPADLMAISPDGAYVLVRATESPGRLDVWGLKDANHWVGWRPYRQADKNDALVTAAAWVDSEHVLTRNRAAELVLWELPACRAVYVITGQPQTEAVSLEDKMRQIEADFREKLERLRSGRVGQRDEKRRTDMSVNLGPAPISPGGKTMVLPRADRLFFVDAATGKVQGATQAPGPMRAAAFHPKGEKFAATFVQPAGGRLLVWDMKSGQVEHDFPLPEAGQTLHWCDRDHLLLDASALISLKHGMIVWSYLGPDAIHSADSPDGRHWCVVRKSRQSRVLCLAALTLPEEPVAEKLMNRKGEPSLILQPGTRVSLRLTVETKPPGQPGWETRIREQFVKKLQEQGIEVTQGQALMFEIRVTQKNTGRQLQFRPFGGRIGTSPNQRSPITVPETIVECSVGLKDKTKVVWQTRRGMSNAKFGITHTRPGETVPQHLARQQWEKVTDYLLQLQPPSHVFADDADQGFGHSVLTAELAGPAEP